MVCRPQEAYTHKYDSSVFYTLIIVLPIQPFLMILRIIVGGGPGTWFILGYILYLAVGFTGHLGFSYLYYLAEKIEGRKLNRLLVWLNILAMYVGITGANFALAIAGILGGYVSTILHSPSEEVRLILEPFVNPIRILSIVAIVGVLSGITALYLSKENLTI
ncbi:MAG: hypothetical protein QXO76_12545 [Thermoproteota archaeon]